MASAPSNTAVATSETSARVGTGAVIIDSSICVATTTGLPARRQARVRLFLDARNCFQRHFHAEIAACDHQCVGKLDDFFDALNSLRLLDLGHQANATARNLAHFGQVFRALNEGKGNPVHFVGCENGVEVDAVLVGQNADAEQGVGQADTLAVGNPGAGNNSGDDALAVALLSAQMQLAVVDQQAVARLDRFENFRMRQENAGVVAGRIVVVQREGLAGNEINLGFGKFTDAQLGTLQVGQNADGTTVTAFNGANTLNQRPHHVVARMAHVDAEEIGAGQMQLFDHCLVGRGGAESCKNFDFAVTLHQF